MKKKRTSTSVKSFFPGDHQAIYEKLKRFAKESKLTIAEAQIDLVCLGLDQSEAIKEQERLAKEEKEKQEQPAKEENKPEKKARAILYYDVEDHLDDLCYLQILLTKIGYLVDEAPGQHFSSHIQDQVVKFQQEVGLTPSGRVDEATWNKLEEEVAKRKES